MEPTIYSGVAMIKFRGGLLLPSLEQKPQVSPMMQRDPEELCTTNVVENGDV